jgi:hypothetical protein
MTGLIASGRDSFVQRAAQFGRLGRDLVIEDFTGRRVVTALEQFRFLP